MNIHPLNKIKIVGTLVGVIAIGLVVGIKAPDHATASTNDNVHGWLWSDMPTGSDQCFGAESTPTNPTGCPSSPLPNTPGVSSGLFGRGLGYVSMNSSDPSMSGTYGVSLDLATGELSGQAYSEWGQWLDFDAVGPYPPYNAATSAKVMPSCWTQQDLDPDLWCNVIGWARFNGGLDPGSGGWDGWVSLNSDIAPVYHVAYQRSTGKFQGLAWGGSVVGWINFDNVYTDLTQPTGVCTDPLALNSVALPLTANQISDPTKCTYPPDFCIQHPTFCEPLDPICKIHPELCDYVDYICKDSNASNFTPPPYSSNQISDDSVCLFIGCMNKCADNYDPNATTELPGSCDFPQIPKPFCVPGPGGPLKPIYKEN